MKRKRTQSGFSLMETLLAVGTLAIGLVFVAGTFLAGVYFATISTEGTIATVVADEAFAKIHLYGLDPNLANLPTDRYVRYDAMSIMPEEEHLYPSTATTLDKQYCWTALCKRTDDDSQLVDVVVFVCRRTGSATRYWTQEAGALTETDTPGPVQIHLAEATGSSRDTDVIVTGTNEEWLLVNDGATLVDDSTGEVYRVLERYSSPQEQIRLDRVWTGAALATAEGASAWVVPQPKSGGRDPLVAIYQRVLRF